MWLFVGFCRFLNRINAFLYSAIEYKNLLYNTQPSMNVKYNYIEIVAESIFYILTINNFCFIFVKMLNKYKQIST